MSVEMTWTPADGAGPAGQFHATEAVNWLRSTNGAGMASYTYSVSVSGMTITFPAFTCYVPNGSGGLTTVVYAGGTLVIAASDPTNPATSMIQINSSGTISEKRGVATAETGDVVEAPMGSMDAAAIGLLKVRIGAGVTSLSDSVMKGRAIDTSQQQGAVALAGSSSAATSTTSTSAVDLVTISGLSISATAIIEMMLNTRKTAAAANAVIFGLKVNSTVFYEAAIGNGGSQSSATQRAEDGWWQITIGPRRTNYPTAYWWVYGWRVSATGANATTTTLNGTSAAAAAVPIATITSMAIRAINDTASNAAEIQDWKIWTR